LCFPTQAKDGLEWGTHICEMYRWHMKTIGYLGQLDRLFGGAATTRNWNTIVSIVRILKGEEKN
jgi:hypothetical protein